MNAILDENQWEQDVTDSIKDKDVQKFNFYFNKDYISKVDPMFSSYERIGYAIIDYFEHNLLLDFLNIVNDASICQKLFDRSGQSNNLFAMKMLLKEYPNNVNINGNGGFAFRWACRKQNLDVLEFLMFSDQLNGHVDISAMNYYGFQMAAANEHYLALELLLSERCNQVIPIRETAYDLNYWLNTGHRQMIKTVMCYIKRTDFLYYIENQENYKIWCIEHSCLEDYEHVSQYTVECNNFLTEEELLHV